MSETRVLVWLLLEQDGAVLLARRKSDRPPFAGQWVLPGDVMPEEESASETAQRAGHDDLDIRVSGDEFVETLYLQDKDADYAVNVFRVAYEGRPRYRESGPYTEVRWVLASTLVAWQGLPRGLPDVIKKATSEIRPPAGGEEASGGSGGEGGGQPPVGGLGVSPGF